MAGSIQDLKDVKNEYDVNGILVGQSTGFDYAAEFARLKEQKPPADFIRSTVILSNSDKKSISRIQSHSQIEEESENSDSDSDSDSDSSSSAASGFKQEKGGSGTKVKKNSIDSKRGSGEKKSDVLDDRETDNLSDQRSKSDGDDHHSQNDDHIDPLTEMTKHQVAFHLPGLVDGFPSDQLEADEKSARENETYAGML